MANQSIFIDEVKVHQKGYKRLFNFTHSSTKAAAVMLAAAIVAIIIANSAWYEPFRAFWDTEIGFSFGANYSSMKLSSIVNDVLMTLFFLLVGLEIKYEMTVGELTNIRQAILPIVAAVGGVLAPVGIYLIFNAGSPETMQGWGVPTATDIAFALGLLSLLGNRVPSGVRVFLSTLAVADDIIAIVVIAVFYGHSPRFFWLILAAVVMLVLIGMNRLHIYSLASYLLVGGVLWFCVFQSGVHSTIAGVLLAFTIPSGSRVNLKSFTEWSKERMDRASDSFEPDEPVIGQKDFLKQVSVLSSIARQVVPPATRLEKMLYPWVYFAVMPLFALTNADVCLAGITPSMLFTDPVFLGVALGLLLGKPIGILAASFLVVKIGKVSLPENVNWFHMAGAAILGGVGFTMAIFVANLAFSDPSHVVVAKTAILFGSTIAGVLGLGFLATQARIAARENTAFVKTRRKSLFLQTADSEDTVQAERALLGESETKKRMDVTERFRRTRQSNIEYGEALVKAFNNEIVSAAEKKEPSTGKEHAQGQVVLQSPIDTEALKEKTDEHHSGIEDWAANMMEWNSAQIANDIVGAYADSMNRSVREKRVRDEHGESDEHDE